MDRRIYMVPIIIPAKLLPYITFLRKCSKHSSNQKPGSYLLIRLGKSLSAFSVLWIFSFLRGKMDSALLPL